MTREISRDHARLLAGRALTLPERLRRLDELAEGDRDEEAVTELLTEWREQFPDETAFQRRLAQLGVEEADCRRAIRADRLAASTPLPEWVERLDTLVADTVEQSPSVAATRERLRSGEDERMFPALSARLAAVAVDRLPERVRERLPAAVVREAAQWFRGRFHRRFDRVLFVEFKTFVAAHDEDRAFADPEAFDDPPTEYYERYHTFLFDDHGFGDVCVEYPVFGRLLTVQLDQWVSYLTEVVDRLDADREAITGRFGDGELGDLVGVEPLADDTHGDGRAVAKLSFDCGTQVVYKPRSVTAGERFYELLTDLNDHLDLPAFAAPTYLDCGSYGWMEWIADEDCADEAAVSRYYERAGGLVAVAYLTEFTDCHHENVVAAGEQPTLVDAETVFHPRFAPGERPTDPGVVDGQPESVVLSALLPWAGGDDDNFGTATAGIAVDPEPTPVPGVTVPRLAATGSDVVDVTEQTAEIEPELNVPAVDGEPALPGAHADEIVAGFRETYETLVSLTERGVVSLEDRFAGVENRLVYRPTMQYARLIDDLESSRVLSDGVQVDVALAELTASVCQSGDGDPPVEIVEAERAALLRLDPPRFGARADGTALYRDGEPVGAAATTSGLSVARERLREAGPSDLAAQTEYVRGAFDGPLVDDRRDDPPSDPSVPDADERRRAAVAAWEQIDEAATWADGVPYWEWIGPWGDETTLPVEHADESLYFGRSGIALLPAALYRVTGEDRFQRAARAVLAPTRDQVEAAVGEGVEALGGTRGVGAVAYGLAAVGSLLDDGELIADAERALSGLSSEAIAADETYDVVGGSAGTLLGLLGAHDRTGDEAFLSWARECGDRLVDAQRPVDAGGAAWDTGEDRPLVGFSHGSSGIAYALARLSTVTGTDRYGTAAAEALRYEATVYDAERENWPDLQPERESFTDQWCHGRAGVVLARLGAAESFDDGLVDRAVATATAPTGPGSDHLCCGVAGRVETLIEGRRRGRDVPSPGPAVGRLVERLHADGGPVTLSNTRHVRSPSLFGGTAGVGYTVLRSGTPERVPSVLLWE